MKEDQRQFLSLLGNPPARLTAEQVAWILNCATYDVPVVVSAGLLKPLGVPAANSPKYFATVEILELAKDRAWLARMSQTLQRFWQRKNGRRNRCANFSASQSETPRPRIAPSANRKNHASHPPL